MSRVSPSAPTFSTTADPAGGVPVDGRQSQAALDIQRGVGRLLLAHGFASITEFSLANGRRADVIGLSQKGDIWIIEVKSSIEDFRADQKWPEYAEFCDRFFFAVAPQFPAEVIPENVGLILADRFGADFVCEAPEQRMAPARRKVMTVRIARAAAYRLQFLFDPDSRIRPPES